MTTQIALKCPIANGLSASANVAAKCGKVKKQTIAL